MGLEDENLTFGNLVDFVDISKDDIEDDVPINIGVELKGCSPFQYSARAKTITIVKNEAGKVTKLEIHNVE